MLRISTLLVLLALATPALADTHLSFVNDSGQPSTQLYVKDGKVRMEGGRGIGLYDAATNTFTMLMPDKKQYLVFDEKSASAMGASANAAQQQMAAHQGQIDQANQQAQAAMANMTPEQKAMMQQMMAGRGGAPGAGPMGGMQMDTKDLGTSETVAGHKCEDMQLVMNGQAMSTMCVMSGPPSALGIPAADVKTLEAMRAGMLKLSAHMGPMGQGMAGMMTKGFSLKTTHQVYRDMQPVTDTDTFKGLSTASLSAALFEIPAGYAQTTMQGMMQQGHP
ncbi:MAG TPA: DUF4412 domain-containing protein [Gammaproteobacteria bacterium]|nr:DUF4412 domain-containing protein [Gammaproteobacteria bacterium]